MNKYDILTQLNNKKVKDYSFTIAFFFVFSFFIVFAIRPNLVAVVSLKEQLTKLRELDIQYEQSITQIINLQTMIEENRDNFYLLDEALPSTPQVNKVIDDISKSASDSGMALQKIDVTEVSLKEGSNRNTTRSFVVHLESGSEFQSARGFIDKLLSQRRLKTLKNLSIMREIGESTQSSALKVKFDIDGFYL